MSKVRLGDVAVEHKETLKGSKDGYPIVGLEHLIPEDIRLTQWSENTDNTFTKVFRKGCVLFGRRRAYLKKAAYAHMDGICSGDITVIEAIPGKILPELLPFIIQNDDLFDFAVGKSAGSLSPRVKWEHLKNYEFELPNLEKQAELARILWSMVETKESYQSLIKATDDLVKSQFIELLPESCEEIKLGQLIDYKPKSNIKAGMGSEKGMYPLFNSSGEQSLWLDSYLYDGETVFIPTGGKAAVNYYNGKCSGTTDNLVFTCKNNVLTKYAYLYLWRDLEILQKGFKGSGLQHISKEYVENITIKVPTIDIQNKIIQISSQSDKSKFELENCLKNAIGMYKKIIKDYLG